MDKTQKKAVKATREVRSERSLRRAEETSEQILLHPGRASAAGVCHHCQSGFRVQMCDMEVATAGDRVEKD